MVCSSMTSLCSGALTQYVFPSDTRREHTVPHLWPHLPIRNLCRNRHGHRRFQSYQLDGYHCALIYHIAYPVIVPCCVIPHCLAAGFGRDRLVAAAAGHTSSTVSPTDTDCMPDLTSVSTHVCSEWVRCTSLSQYIILLTLSHLS